MDSYRQGDVFIYRVDGLPRRKLSRVARNKGRIVLAYGERTGHAHAIADRKAELLEAEGLNDRFLRVLAEGGVEPRRDYLLHAGAGARIGACHQSSENTYGPQQNTSTYSPSGELGSC